MNKEKYIRMRCDDITLNTFIGDAAVLHDNKKIHGPMLTHISPPPSIKIPTLVSWYVKGERGGDI